MASLDVALQAVGGIPLVLLGAAVLLLPRRRADAYLLAAFCLLWGAAVELIALNRWLDAGPDAASAFTIGYNVLNVVAGASLLGFVAWMRVPVRHKERMTTLILVGVALGLSGIAFPDTHLPVIVYFLFLSGAIVIAYRGYRRSQPGTARRRERLLLSALGLVPSFLLVSFVATALRKGDMVTWIEVAALAPVALVHAHALARPPRLERRDPWLATAFLLPIATGVLVALDPVNAGAGVTGLWRFATAALLALAIARTRLFDVDLRLRRAAGPTLGTLAALVGIVVALVLASPFPLALGLGAGLMLVGAREPVGTRLFPIEGPQEEHVRARKVEVYAAALHASIRAGLGADDPEVRRLRRTFDVTDTEHLAALATADAPRTERRLVLGRYRLLHALGDGGQGCAFLARDERTGVDVAVKLVSRYGAAGRAGIDALLAEARLASSLEHRHIVKVLAGEEEGDDGVLVMEYAAGGSLRDVLRRRGPTLAPDEAAQLVDDVLSALAACHARGIVHGDVKPENVLLDAGKPPRAMLADFGVARQATAGATAATGGAIGTLLYMSPEQVQGKPARPESDVYAACVMLHEVLTGRHPLPLAGRDDFQIRQLILEGAHDLALRGDAARYQHALLAGLAPRAEDRPDAATLRRMLSAEPSLMVRRA